jgi:hypothetical protein
MKFIIIHYSPDFKSRIIPVSEIIAIFTEVAEEEDQRFLKLRIITQSEEINASWLDEPRDFWESFEKEETMYVDSFEEKR